MACGSSCCRPPEHSSSPPVTEQPSSSTPPAPETEQIGTENIEDQVKSETASCRDSCCDKAADTSQEAVVCGPQQAEGCSAAFESDLGDECCREAESGLKLQLAEGDSKDPICCRGKPSPCCDDSCLQRLAVRACREGDEDAKSTTLASSSSSTCLGQQEGKPCEYHTRTTREKYAATLEAIGCICRALLALGQESCCPLPGRERTSTEKRRDSKAKGKNKEKSSSIPCADSCCATGAASTSASPGEVRSRTTRNSCGGGSSSTQNVCSKGCCTPAITTVRDPCQDSCCGDIDDEDSASRRPHEKDVPTTLSVTRDIEKGLIPGGTSEHVVLSIAGMTCTGCETKLQRTLGTLASVRNLKTSLVLARAEFDLESGSSTSLTDVLKHLHKTTEFKCERVRARGSNIRVITPYDAATFMEQPWPKGVAAMTSVGKDTIDVSFDPSIIGSRDLVEKGWPIPVVLAPPQPDPTLEAGSKHVRHMGLMTCLSALLTIPVLVMDWAPLPANPIACASASFALATIVQIVVAGPFYPKALKSLVFSRMVEMDLLIVLSTTAAYVFSVVSFGYLVAGWPLSTGQFFATSTLLVTLIMVGRYVSALARHKAVESIFSVRSLQRATAVLVLDDDGEREIDVRLLQHGDKFRVVPDSSFPTDGVVVSGTSEVDESMVTGESRPVAKEVGSTVVAGSINGSGILIVRLTRLPGDNTISAIAMMVDEAKLSKPKMQELADRVASYFVPVVVALTVITFVIWVAVGVAVQKQSGSEAAIQALTYAITVLIVSCPCAIGLAVPMVVVIASGLAAERGIVIKSADAIEVAHRTSHVVFDKTGTLTEGKLTVVCEEYLDGDSALARSLLLGLVSGNKHPVSAAVASYLAGDGVKATVISDAKNLPGKGIQGTASSLVLRAGNARWLGVSDHALVRSVASDGRTVFCFTVDGCLKAVFGLSDVLRPEALRTVTELHTRGISIHVLSGDDDGAVHAAAHQLGITTDNVRSRCTPADKQCYIQALFEAKPHGRSTPPTVIFCGDGTNDAPALAQATVSVHMSSNTRTGTDAAQSAADVVLMRADLAGVLALVDLSARAVRRIRFNFAWSFVYNLAAVLLGAGAFRAIGGGAGPVRIPPEYAGLGELVSVLPVVAAAVLLRWV